MKQFLLLMLIGMSMATSSFGAALVASVDRHKISENETINLTITLDDASFSGSPDLAGLDNDFQILSQRSSSSTSLINGEYSAKKEWHYTLRPKKTGKLWIPSFRLKNIFSDAVEIEVQSENADTVTTQQGDIFLEQTVDKSSAYVQERITLTLQVFTAVNITRPAIPDPVLPNFMIKKIGQNEFQSKRNGRDYYVLEFKYGLFPNKSGTAVLPKQRYQISQIINNGQRSPFNIPGFGSPLTQTHMLSSAEIILTIKPQPENLPESYWLPSESVTITDNWPEQQTAEIGVPLTRSIEIKALGNLAAHIPALPNDTIAGLKTYAEQAELTNTATNDNFLALRKENIAIVPVQAGTYILPSIQLHWWDTNARQFKTSTLPERTLTVTAGSGTSPSTPDMTSSTAIQQIPPTHADAPLVYIAPASNTATPLYLNAYTWMATALFFVILWVITLAILLKHKIQNNSLSDATSSADTAQSTTLKTKFKQLKSACQANNAPRARSLLIEWGQLQWPEAKILTLDQLKQQVHNDQFSMMINELDGALYHGSTVWAGTTLLNFLQDTTFTSRTIADASLPKLYE